MPPKPLPRPDSDLVEDLCLVLYGSLRTEGPDAAPDPVPLACALFDAGHRGDAVREVLECTPAALSGAELAALAARLLSECAFDPGFTHAPERLEVLRGALRVAARDLPSAGHHGAPRLMLLEDAFPPAAGVVLADGRRLEGGLLASTGDDPTGAVAAVAEHLQEGLMTLTRRVWPVCDRHGLGVHPVVRNDAAVWWCAAAQGPPLARVGELTRSRRQ
ncbi:hypothetical protein GCM10010329_59230 [Streptomyces spiroverticillatus]|uniref:Uncharacterized protein n=1 Tax=Streptomyces finlayi TaxID=67296 RepID=A0A919CCX3_9ACTN|nr:hypothetical protein [Streptomyces finlayi]GHA28266.1 hypothetical protein GCM10010329_59230 [Streptomyces spiroverticillatus]GHD09012.1 hypothetical protein GCM10010334_62890 [Streptomyces finlayi]